jgi:cell division protein FtsA
MKKEGSSNKGRSGLVAALDVGSSKVCCLIARLGNDGKAKIVGIGHQASVGLRSGAIVDMDAAEASIRATVEAAEEMAGENIKSVVVNVSCGEPQSRLVSYEVSIAGHEIGDADLRRILDPSAARIEQEPGRDYVHAIPVGYRVDGNRGIRDPRGMFGQTLGVNMHLVSAATTALRNLRTCIARCHLGIEGQVMAPYAAALSSLVEDEMQLGAILLDMGGGTTSIAFYFDGELVHTDSVPIGGIHVTRDIARCLSTPMAHAERMKTLYGSAIGSASDEREVIKVPLIGEDDEAGTQSIQRSFLISVIKPRLEETFEMVRARLEHAGLDKAAGRRLVLTGGASQLPGARELAGMILDKQVRAGRPQPMEGLAEAVAGPAFATPVGLLTYALGNPADGPNKAIRPLEEPKGRLGRFGQWIRENF